MRAVSIEAKTVSSTLSWPCNERPADARFGEESRSIATLSLQPFADKSISFAGRALSLSISVDRARWTRLKHFPILSVNLSMALAFGLSFNLTSLEIALHLNARTKQSECYAVLSNSIIENSNSPSRKQGREQQPPASRSRR
jgi:hypothetical protein